MTTTHKYREGLRERLGKVPRRILDATGSKPVIQPSSQPVLWLHAVSVGEVLAVSRLISELESELPTYRLVLSTTTRTGQALARERFGASRVFYCPLDLPWAVNAYLDELKPRMLILAETEFWPNLLSACFHRAIPVVVVNARISDRSWPRYRRLRALWRPFLSKLTAVLAQTAIDADRLRAIGCQPDRVSVSGNLKFDIRSTQESAATTLLRTLSGNHRLIVAGSTLDGEEEILLAAWTQLQAKTGNTTPGVELALILAPRHPERFPQVASLLQQTSFPWRRRSAIDIGQSPKKLAPEKLAPGEIILLDSIGELASVYSLATIAFVGGSLVEAGGHNPLEPAQFSIPIVMGPHYANFRGIVDQLRTRQALTIADKSTLATTLISLLTNPAEASAMGKQAHHVFETQSGATARTVAAIHQILNKIQHARGPR